jgi:hypothetical protein
MRVSNYGNDLLKPESFPVDAVPCRPLKIFDVVLLIMQASEMQNNVAHIAEWYKMGLLLYTSFVVSDAENSSFVEDNLVMSNLDSAQSHLSLEKKSYP